MDDEAIIEAVEKRKALYDRNGPKCNNRKLINAFWEECAEELGTDVLRIKKRWAFLRDYFCQQYRILQGKRAGFPTKRKKKWPLYDRMKFLIPHLQDSQEQYVLESDLQVNEAEKTTVVCYPEAPCYPESGSIGSVPKASESANISSESTSKRPVTSDVQSLRPQKSSKTSFSLMSSSLGNEYDIDDDAHFLESLLPMMRQLDPFLRMEFRIEAQSLLLQCQKRSFQTPEMFHAFHPSESTKTITISSFQDS